MALFNKVGDLYLKTNNVNSAVAMYDRAAHRYIESGFPNNAIALCNKILRNAPGRTQTYLMLAELMMQRGFAAEAKQHFIEYADRMSKAGRVVDAFKALKKFADASPQNDDVRTMLVQQVEAARAQAPNNSELEKLYQELTGAAPEEEAAAPAPGRKSKKSADLVFIDLDDSPEAPSAVEETPLPIESTSLANDDMLSDDLEIDSTTLDGGVDGLETATEFESEAPADPEHEPATSEDVGGDLELITPDGNSGGAPAEAAVDEVSFGDDVELADLDIPDIDLDGPDAAAPAAKSKEDQRLEEYRRASEQFQVESQDDASSLLASITEDQEEDPAKRLANLERQVAASPDDARARRDLAEHLLQHGDRDRGLEELGATLTLMEDAENWEGAQGVAEEIIRLDPNSVAHHQKRVEYAYRLGQKSSLVPAYLSLADALFRSGALDQSRAVFERVLELDPANASALQSLETITPVEPLADTPAAAPPPRASTASAQAEASRAQDEFVDLGGLILDDEEESTKSTRMLGYDEQSGDEQRDFDVMLSQFKKGIEQNIDDSDAPAHYDLGVAFKEMGLLDEAISEFQKSLRAPDTHLRSAEMLGLCFYEKGQYQVAITVMRRAVEGDPGGDETKVGLLYWLGRCEEEQGRSQPALDYYQRVFAVDINFQDVSQRVDAIVKAGR